MQKTTTTKKSIGTTDPSAGEHQKNVNQSRRNALKTLAMGSAAAGTLALGGKWAKPVVDTIVLPAHAQATNAAGPVGTTPAPTCNTNVTFACYTVDTGKAAHGKLVLPLAGVYVEGDITPAQAGVAITVELHTVLISQATRTDTLQTTTDSSGHSQVTQSWTANDGVNYIDKITVIGPCNSLDAIQCPT